MNLKHFIFICWFIAFGAGMFFLGLAWSKYNLLANNRYKLQNDLELIFPKGEQCIIPSGTRLYHYDSLPETSHYVLFIESKGGQIFVPDAELDHHAVLYPVNSFPN